MARIDGWEVRLNDVIDAALHEPFVWGQQDCSLFAAKCADAVNGTSIEAKHRGRYKTLRGATGRMKRLGGCEGVLRSEGFVKVLTLFAQRGDIVIINQEGREAMGVINGGKIVAASHDGLVFLPMTEAVGVWRK